MRSSFWAQNRFSCSAFSLITSFALRNPQAKLLHLFLVFDPGYFSVRRISRPFLFVFKQCRAITQRKYGFCRLLELKIGVIIDRLWSIILFILIFLWLFFMCLKVSICLNCPLSFPFFLYPKLRQALTAYELLNPLISCSRRIEHFDIGYDRTFIVMFC